MATERVEVKVGQLWRDNDKRTEGRILRVTGFIYDGNHVPFRTICCRVGASDVYTKISIERLQSSAFTMIRDEDGKRIEVSDGE